MPSLPTGRGNVPVARSLAKHPSANGRARLRPDRAFADSARLFPLDILGFLGILRLFKQQSIRFSGGSGFQPRHIPKPMQHLKAASKSHPLQAFPVREAVFFVFL